MERRQSLLLSVIVHIYGEAVLLTHYNEKEQDKEGKYPLQSFC
jgi:hypothetical protein